jgi:hypothetical protein
MLGFFNDKKMRAIVILLSSVMQPSEVSTTVPPRGWDMTVPTNIVEIRRND